MVNSKHLYWQTSRNKMRNFCSDRASFSCRQNAIPFSRKTQHYMIQCILICWLIIAGPYRLTLQFEVIVWWIPPMSPVPAGPGTCCVSVCANMLKHPMICMTHPTQTYPKHVEVMYWLIHVLHYITWEKKRCRIDRFLHDRKVRSSRFYIYILVTIYHASLRLLEGRFGGLFKGKTSWSLRS